MLHRAAHQHQLSASLPSPFFCKYAMQFSGSLPQKQGAYTQASQMLNISVSCIVVTSVHLRAAILAVFFGRFVPTAFSGNDKAARRAAPLVPAKMYPPPMHHRHRIDLLCQCEIRKCKRSAVVKQHVFFHVLRDSLNGCNGFRFQIRAVGKVIRIVHKFVSQIIHGRHLRPFSRRRSRSRPDVHDRDGLHTIPFSVCCMTDNSCTE